MEPDNDDNCVEGGPFSKDKWRLLNVSGGGCLKTDFTKVSLRYNSDQVNNTLSLPLEDFKKLSVWTIRLVACLTSQSVAQLKIK